MHTHGFERCETDDPNRCQAVNKQGQCLNKAVELPNGGYGTQCLAHGGNKQQESDRQSSYRNYKLTKWHARLQRHSDSEHLKSLRDEIGILRILMEERLERCKDAHDLILQSGPISDLVMKIERTVTACHKLEGSMGQLLDKQAILQFANEVITVVTNNVTDEQQIDLVAEGILQLIGRIGE